MKSRLGDWERLDQDLHRPISRFLLSLWPWWAKVQLLSYWSGGGGRVAQQPSRDGRVVNYVASRVFAIMKE